MLEVYALKLNFNQHIESSVVDELMTCVEPSKEVRLKRFVREQDRLRGLFADLLIRDLIIKRVGLTNEDIEFVTNEYGKPFLKDFDDVHFNLSHSGDWVVAAIDDKPVGIDIEEIQDIDLDISRNYFSEDEHRALMAQPDRLAYFFSLWSLKESYIKIIGKGLSHPLNAFSVSFNSDAEIIINVDSKPLENIFLKQYDVDSNYKMGICAQHNSIPDKLNMLTMEELSRRFVDNFGSRQYYQPRQNQRPAPNSYVQNYRNLY